MAEYIERDELYIQIRKRVNNPAIRSWFGAMLAEIPAADVAPVRNAEWIGVWYDGYADGSPVYEEFECSNCGCEHHADDEPTWRFCPDCGAKMDL